MKWGFSTELKRLEPVPGALHCFNEHKVFHQGNFTLKLNSILNMWSSESVNHYYLQTLSIAILNVEFSGPVPPFTYIVCTTLVICNPKYFLSRL